MSALNHFVVCNLKYNKNRTFVTIIGIALASCLLFSMGFLFSVIREYMIENAISKNGLWHMSVTNERILDFKEYSIKVQSEINLGNFLVEFPSGQYSIPFMGIHESSDLSLKEGVYPEDQYQILISSNLASKFHFKRVVLVRVL